MKEKKQGCVDSVFCISLAQQFDAIRNDLLPPFGFFQRRSDRVVPRPRGYVNFA
jgi:hypothetical protein